MIYPWMLLLCTCIQQQFRVANAVWYCIVGVCVCVCSLVYPKFLHSEQTEMCALAKATLKMSFIFTRANTTATLTHTHGQSARESQKPETAQHIRLAQWQQRAASAINQMALIKIWTSEKKPEFRWRLKCTQLKTIHQNPLRAADYVHLNLFN